MKSFFLAALAILIAVWVYLSVGKKPIPEASLATLTWKDTPEEVQKYCAQAQKVLLASIDDLEKSKPAPGDYTKTVLALENSIDQFREVSEILSFYKYVGGDEKLRQAGDKCENESAKLLVDVMTRKGLFALVKGCKTSCTGLGSVEQLLTDEYFDDFRRNGLELSDAAQEQMKKKQNELVDLQSEFQTRLNEWDETVEFSKAELAGLNPDFIAELKPGKTPDHYLVTLQYPHYFPVMDNAQNYSVREKIQKKFMTRGGERNRELLQRALQLRTELAQLLGYETHATFVLEKKMAKTPEAVNKFLDDLQGKLQQAAKGDMAELLELKKNDPHAKPGTQGRLHMSEARYYAYQLKKKKYQVDEEGVKQYFPLDKVLGGMFEIYQTLLGVTFTEIKDAKTWHADVKAYEVKAKDSGKTLAYFYMDLFPRKGKYGHAAAFTLRSGRSLAGGYRHPVSAIVANFNAPTKDKPALLLHDQVETMLHEFGHIMHQVLTTAPYPSFSGTSVKGDFVEAPSQMLENWAWQEESLKLLSGHYQTGEKLPKALLDKMLAARKSGRALTYLRQLFFAKIDMRYHDDKSPAQLDTSKLYADLSEQITMLESARDIYPEASFGHLMGGYDAGYYGYLWSEVFAADMFTRFAKEGLLSAAVGKDYLTFILQPGGSEEPAVLIEKFLGRPANNQAFLKDLGL